MIGRAGPLTTGPTGCASSFWLATSSSAMHHHDGSINPQYAVLPQVRLHGSEGDGPIIFNPIPLAGTWSGEDERCLQNSTSRTILRSSSGCRSEKRRRRTLLRSAVLQRFASFLTQSFPRRRRRLIGQRSRGSRCRMSCLDRTRSEFCPRQSLPKGSERGPVPRPLAPYAVSRCSLSLTRSRYRATTLPRAKSGRPDRTL